MAPHHEALLVLWGINVMTAPHHAVWKKRSYDVFFVFCTIRKKQQWEHQKDTIMPLDQQCYAKKYHQFEIKNNPFTKFKIKQSFNRSPKIKSTLLPEPIGATGTTVCLPWLQKVDFSPQTEIFGYFSLGTKKVRTTLHEKYKYP